MNGVTVTKSASDWLEFIERRQGEAIFAGAWDKELRCLEFIKEIVTPLERLEVDLRTTQVSVPMEIVKLL